MNRNIISVCFTPEQFYHYSDLNSIVVVVDVLRATSVISTVFEYGINAVIPVKSIDEALVYKDKNEYIIAAERNTNIVQGFEFGNSPFHYINKDIKNKKLVLTTTNGTKAIHLASKHTVITASFININAVVDFLIKEERDVIILCSGWKNIFNLEDSIFAGKLSSLLIDTKRFTTNCDSLLASQELFTNARKDVFSFLNYSSYRNRNNSKELIRDTEFCLSPPISSDIIPLFVSGELIKHYR